MSIATTTLMTSARLTATLIQSLRATPMAMTT
jgi:hypothetical protein